MIDLAQAPVQKRPHPAKYSPQFFPIFYQELKDCESIMDPMAGTGSLHNLRSYGYDGILYMNEIEHEWAKQIPKHPKNYIFCGDYKDLILRDLDAVCVSPPYGNKMADKDLRSSKESITYSSYLGRLLNEKSAASIQWSEKYKNFVKEFIKVIETMLKPGGIFVLNIKNHIRRKEEQLVSEYYLNIVLNNNFIFIRSHQVPVKSATKGRNYAARVNFENIFVFKKGEE